MNCLIKTAICRFSIMFMFVLIANLNQGRKTLKYFYFITLKTSLQVTVFAVPNLLMNVEIGLSVRRFKFVGVFITNLIFYYSLLNFLYFLQLKLFLIWGSPDPRLNQIENTRCFTITIIYIWIDEMTNQPCLLVLEIILIFFLYFVFKLNFLLTKAFPFSKFKWNLRRPE